MLNIIRRSFLVGSVAAVAAPALGRAAAGPTGTAVDLRAKLAYPFVLPVLPYAYEANEPSIDAETMRLHHDKHHAAYVANLNGALKDRPELHDLSLQQLLSRPDDLPESIRTAVRNNAGGHANHTMFWQVMGGHGGDPEGDLATAVTRDFGSLEALRSSFDRSATGVFGSGWAMVLADKDGKLTLVTKPNQDSPIVHGRNVLFGNDVWEHSYYLKYQNRRADYLAAWWKVLDWGRIAERYALIRSGSQIV